MILARLDKIITSLLFKVHFELKAHSPYLDLRSSSESLTQHLSRFATFLEGQKPVKHDGT